MTETARLATARARRWEAFEAGDYKNWLIFLLAARQHLDHSRYIYQITGTIPDFTI